VTVVRVTPTGVVVGVVVAAVALGAAAHVNDAASSATTDPSAPAARRPQRTPPT
jgi:hypothetical protein